MTSAIAVPALENMVVNITQETKVRASLEVTFAALLEQLGPGFDGPDGKAMPFKLEAFPGGRWFRDLGDGNGHFWGHVQAIKRPTLLEFCGPLMMSFAVASNVQYRLSEVEGGTLISFHHYVFGVIPDGHRENMNKGWTHILERIRTRAEAKK
jgi:hypothetical protein